MLRVSNDSLVSGGEGGRVKGVGKKWKTEEGGSGIEEEEEGGDQEEEGEEKVEGKEWGERSEQDTSLGISRAAAKTEERETGWAHEAGAGLGSMLEMFCIPMGREGQKRFCMP